MARPELHVTAEHGIINAPAGVLRLGDVWHMFHQYQPDYSSRRRWGHQVSFDGPYYWEACDDVLAPGNNEDGVWAGSAIPSADGTGASLYYTLQRQSTTCVLRADIDDLAATTNEIADDPLSLYPGIYEDEIPVADFASLRSPCVFGDSMLACGEVEGETRLLLFRRNFSDTADEEEFLLRGPIEFAGETGLNITQDKLVSPRLIQLRDEVDEQVYDIFLTTIETGERDISGYLVGQLTGTTFEVKTPFTRLDFGHDFARPRNTNIAGTAPRDKAWLFGLLNGSGRFDNEDNHPHFAEEGWANCLTLPRETTLQDGRLFQTPAPGLRDALQSSLRASAWTGIIDTHRGKITVALHDTDGNVAATIEHAGDTLSLTRDGQTVQAPLIAADSDTLSIIVDGPTVEVFADGGVVAMASRIPLRTPCALYEVTVEGDAEIEYSDCIRSTATTTRVSAADTTTQ